MRTSAFAEQIQSQTKIIPIYDNYGFIQRKKIEVIKFTLTTVNEDGTCKHKIRVFDSNICESLFEGNYIVKILKFLYLHSIFVV